MYKATLINKMKVKDIIEFGIWDKDKDFYYFTDKNKETGYINKSIIWVIEKQ